MDFCATGDYDLREPLIQSPGTNLLAGYVSAG